MPRVHSDLISGCYMSLITDHLSARNTAEVTWRVTSGTLTHTHTHTHTSVSTCRLSPTNR